MNLETRVDPRLWEAIRSSVEARQFTAAVLDAIHLLSELIRERSGLEGDGLTLVGSAFGGSSPKLKVNRLQTESEQNVQKGVEALLRGMYQAIRNPRSHDTYHDDERDAVAIVLFLDYLLRIVDKSTPPFTLSSCVARILDRDFVPNERYAQLLLEEIPEKRRLAVCRELFVRRREANRKRVAVFFQCILKVLNDDEKAEFSELVSRELRETDDDDTVRFVRGALPAEIWPTLSEIARLRIEHKLIVSIESGTIDSKGCNAAGSLGTWAQGILSHLVLKNELWECVFEKLDPLLGGPADYVIEYFMPHVQQAFGEPPQHLVRKVRRGLKTGDQRFKELADRWTLDDDFKVRSDDHPWRAPFNEALASFVGATPPPDDDVPF
jgi:uncharacterized protein (TIGR02391 family)